METEDPSDDPKQVRLTLRLPRDLHERLITEAEKFPNGSLNGEIVHLLNAGLLDPNNPEAAVRQIRKLAFDLTAYFRSLKREMKLLEAKAAYYEEMARKGWEKLQDEGRDPYEFFVVARPSDPQKKAPPSQPAPVADPATENPSPQPKQQTEVPKENPARKHELERKRILVFREPPKPKPE